jgi:hypothetical protein
MTGTSPLSDERQIAGVIAAALRLAGASLSTTPDGVHEATLPTSEQHYFGNRSRIKYTLDRTVRQYHADVEYATLGSALVTQAIQYIRENTSVVHTRNVVNGARSEDLVQALIDQSLTLRSVQPERIIPDYLVRAHVLVTMASDDRRSFLHEVITPLGIPPDRMVPASALLASVSNIGEAHTDVPVAIREVVTRVLEAAEVQLKPTIAAREAELEAQLQEASRRLPRAALDALQRDLALRIELDVAYLELARLGRVRYRSTVLEPSTNVQHVFDVEAYEGQSIQVPCPSCKGITARVDLCSAGGVHLTCPACAIRCSACSTRRCRQHPIGSCVEPTCQDGFCDACTRQCSQCGGRACAVHRCDCAAGCVGECCTNCRAECVFEPGVAWHSSHLQACRDCARPACEKHSNVCGLEGPGTALLCEDHLAPCAIEGHSLAVCSRHSAACAACGRIGCSQHQEPCADCGRAACVDDAQPCAVGSEWLLKIHSKSCADCGDQVCASHSGTCALCSKSFCSRHLLACSVAGELVCRADSTHCPECGDSSCQNHAVLCVVGIGHRVCDRDQCRSLCAEDGRPVCQAHRVNCERGSETVCPMHTIRCTEGGEKLCHTHAITCQIAGEYHCQVHSTECGVCGRRTCLHCSTSRIPQDVPVCDACLSAAPDRTTPLSSQRPALERMLVREPLVARSRSVVSVVSISPVRAEVRTFNETGDLVTSRRLDRERARAYRQLLLRRSASSAPE